MKQRYIIDLDVKDELGDLTENIRDCIANLLFSLEGNDSKGVRIIRNK